MLQRERRFDYWVPLCAFALSALGVLSIYSTAHIRTPGFWQKQIIWILMGTSVGAVVAWVDYRTLARLSRFIYALNLLMLLAVIFGGHEVKGAQRWISIGGGFTLQPSEFAKLFTIITLASYAAAHRSSLRQFWGLCKAGLHVVPPMLLILKQPDLGTSLVLIAIWFGVMWVAGASAKHLGALALAGMLAFTTMWHVGLIKDYQKQRFVSFWNPKADPRGSGYHTIQSKIAIGSGGLTGKGYLHGTQSQGGFIPEQHTDFVNTVIGEELGFIGSSLLLALFFCLIFRGVQIAGESDDATGRLMAAGVVAMFTFHVFVNLGMTIHIMPVTGVPLPFLSYGGSSMLVNMMCAALLVNIHRRREALRF